MLASRLRDKIVEHAVRHAPPGSRLGVKRLGPARLAGWRFAVDLYSNSQESLVCDIFPGSPADEVWGVVYELDPELVRRSDGRRSVMDRIEGYRTEGGDDNYEPFPVTVEMSGASVEAVTYVGTRTGRERCRDLHADAIVIAGYGAAVLNGADEARLPPDYQEEIRRSLETAGYQRSGGVTT